MASTYTPKLNLAKPAHGDVDWHIPINENWDKIDTELGTLTKNIEVGETEITFDKKVIANEVTTDNFSSSKVMLYPLSIVKTKRVNYSTSTPGTVGTFTIPSQYVEGSALGFEGTLQAISGYHSYPTCYIYIKVNGVDIKSYSTWATAQSYGSIAFEDYISIKGNDIVSVNFVIYNQGSGSGSCSITFYGDDIPPFTVPHPTWS
jgi:hypothetical protein